MLLCSKQLFRLTDPGPFGSMSLGHNPFLYFFCLTAGHHTRSRRSFRVHHCRRLPPACGGLLALLSSRPCWAEGRGLRHGGQRHPRQAARDSSSADQGLPGEDASSWGAVPWPEAETQNQHRGQSARRRGGKIGPQT